MSEKTNQTDIIIEDTINDPEYDFEGSFEDGENQIPSEEEKPLVVKYNGKELEMTMEELKAAAQKGLNYDKVKAQRDALSQEEDDLGLSSFLDEYPNIDPESIPQEVYEKAQEEGGLLSAYRVHILKTQANEIEQLKKENENLKKSPGTLTTDGESSYDPFLAGLFGN